ncbi:RES family NAD+ phosphorylase [Prescottella subtropica]|uniref:RES family NAD+ phosphorylase n=1 Tax=Prescottella subtropica TaxID=2545757 RepID=UPI0010F84B7E|nr:RES family NAD+ phosphorylase [Prescottella subtropica]
MTPDLPRPPHVADLRAHGILDDEHLDLPPETVIWRVHRTRGGHVLAWNRLRTFGPLLRFDPHPRPRRDHPRHGVWYGAADVPGALAETFQATRVVDRAACAPYLTGLCFTRPLRLLDLGGFGDGRWPTRVGGNFALATTAHGLAQHWARTIRAAHPDLDGLAYRGRFSGGLCVALFPPAADAFPAAPQLSLPLEHPALASRLAGAADRIGYGVV